VLILDVYLSLLPSPLFTGFLLTYLLHTTHASKCGSRAGLGITLIQYGFYLRTRSIEGEDGSSSGDPASNNVNPNGSTTSTIHTWWGGDIEIEVPAASPSARQEPTSAPHSLADIFAASADSPGAEASVGGHNSISENLKDSSEWLSYVLMIVGWFILLSSLLSYWRVHRWGKQLVDGARRERERAENENETTTTTANAETDGMSLIERLRARLSTNNNGREASHSAEDWIVFPGLGRRLGVVSERGDGVGNTEGYNLDLENGLRDAENDSDDEDGGRRESGNSNHESRLLRDMRSVGLIG